MTALRRTSASPGRLLGALALAAVPLLAGAVPAAAAPPASLAASEACVEIDVREPNAAQVRDFAAKADDVFVGEVVSSRRSEGSGSGRNSDGTAGTGGTDSTESTDGAGGQEVTRFEHRVDVMPVLRGDLTTGSRAVVMTDTSEEGLGRLRTGDQYVFFTTDVETGSQSSAPQLLAPDCSGTTRLPDRLSARLQRTLERILSDEEPERVVPTFEEPEGGAPEAPSLTRAVAPGVALGIVGVLGLLLVSRLGRRG